MIKDKSKSILRKKIKKKIKNIIAKILQPRGFTVDGIKPAGSYISKHELNYKEKGFANLREFYENKWNVKVQDKCQQYVDIFFKKRLSGQETVLEIGTGIGFITDVLFMKFPRLKYISFELDKNLQNYLDQEYKNYNFISHECIGNNLYKVEDDSVDLIIAFGIFTYVNFSNMIQYLYEADRVCKKNGLLFFDIFDTDSITNPLCQVFEEYSFRGDNRPFISANLLKKILEKRGFILIDSFQEKGIEGKNLQYYSHKLLFQKIITVTFS